GRATSDIVYVINTLPTHLLLLVYALTLARFFTLRIQRPQQSTLYPYTTLFRSRIRRHSIAVPEAHNGNQHWALVRIFEPLGDERSEEHTSELQSRGHLVCRLLLEKKKESPGRCS